MLTVQVADASVPRELCEVGEVGPVQGGGVIEVESLLAELPEGLEQPVPGGVAVTISDHEAALDEPIEPIAQRPFVEPQQRPADRPGGDGIEPGREHAQALEEPSVGLVEQLVGPLHGRLQCLMTLHATASGSPEQPESVIEAVLDLGEGHRPHPRHGRLDRERDPVEPLTDPRDRPVLVGGRGETGVGLDRALHEQVRRLPQ